MSDEPPEQTLTVGPATAVAAARMVKVLFDKPLVQPGLIAVNVKVTLPAVLSAALGL